MSPTSVSEGSSRDLVVSTTLTGVSMVPGMDVVGVLQVSGTGASGGESPWVIPRLVLCLPRMAQSVSWRRDCILPMRILIVSDAWFPQVNGVVRALSTTQQRLTRLGHQVEVIGPHRFKTVRCPTYPEIRLSVTGPNRVGRLIEAFAPDAVHLATEGPLGWSARHWLRRRGLPFTTSFHTLFPLYLKLRAGVPERWSFGLLRRFHNGAAHTMSSTSSLDALLRQHGIRTLVRWIRGVDRALFRPVEPAQLSLPRPVLMYVGRLAVEKNLEAFLRLDSPGAKVLVGDGPARPELQRRFPQAVYLGVRQGEDLAAHYCAADVLVFPSKTDTLGLVMLEALACGIPVAAYPVPGPNDIIGGSGAGALHEDLALAVEAALGVSPEICQARAAEFDWEVSVRQFQSNLVAFRPARLAEAA